MRTLEGAALAVWWLRLYFNNWNPSIFFFFFFTEGEKYYAKIFVLGVSPYITLTKPAVQGCYRRKTTVFGRSSEWLVTSITTMFIQFCKWYFDRICVFIFFFCTDGSNLASENEPVPKTQIDICQMDLFLSVLFSTWPGQSQQAPLLLRPNAMSPAITAEIGLNWPLVLHLSHSPKHNRQMWIQSNNPQCLTNTLTR